MWNVIDNINSLLVHSLPWIRFSILNDLSVKKEERREGHSYIEPSWIASHIYAASVLIAGRDDGRTVWAHRSSMAARSRLL